MDRFHRLVHSHSHTNSEHRTTGHGIRSLSITENAYIKSITVIEIEPYAVSISFRYVRSLTSSDTAALANIAAAGAASIESELCTFLHNRT